MLALYFQTCEHMECRTRPVASPTQARHHRCKGSEEAKQEATKRWGGAVARHLALGGEGSAELGFGELDRVRLLRTRTCHLTSCARAGALLHATLSSASLASRAAFQPHVAPICAAHAARGRRTLLYPRVRAALTLESTFPNQSVATSVVLPSICARMQCDGRRSAPRACGSASHLVRPPPCEYKAGKAARVGHARMPRHASIARDASAHLDVIEAQLGADDIKLLFAK